MVYSEGKIEELVERFNLDVALKSFVSQSLEKRLRGVKYMKRMVARTDVKGMVLQGYKNFKKNIIITKNIIKIIIFNFFLLGN